MGCIFPVVTTSVRTPMGTATAAGIMLRQTGASLGYRAGAMFTARMAATGAGAIAPDEHAGFNLPRWRRWPRDARGHGRDGGSCDPSDLSGGDESWRLWVWDFAFVLQEVPLTNHSRRAANSAGGEQAGGRTGWGRTGWPIYRLCRPEPGLLPRFRQKAAH